MSDSTKGTTIIERAVIGTAYDDTELVLVKREHGHTPYVIWKRFKSTENQGVGAYTYSGYYFEDFIAAVKKWLDIAPDVPMSVEWEDETGQHHVDIDGSIA